MPKHIKELHDRDWLKEAYATQTVRQIAERLKCSPTGVSHALRRHGIDRRPEGRARVDARLNDREWLEAAYAQHTSYEIARDLGCNAATVREHLRMLDIPVRRKVKRRRDRSHYPCMTPVAPGRTALIHRFLMEEHLGYQLPPNMHVHHIDGVRWNYALDNLMVMPQKTHHRLHGLSRGFPWHDWMGFNHTCTSCGIQFRGGNRAIQCPQCRHYKKLP